MRRTTLPLAFVAALLFGSAARAETPKLLVLIAVDQMRADYVEWYGAHWRNGLKRIYDNGAQFTNARFPYLSTTTCPGHATLGTGSYPHRHGMIQNTWYDRERKKVIECTDDPSAALIGHSEARLGNGDSAKNLMAPTIGDEMQAQLQPRPRVVGLSLKARSAIDLAGHKPDLVLWRESSTWVTSNAFAAGPIAWVQQFLRDNAPSLDTPWERLLPAAAYKHDDDDPGEKPPRNWGRTFPHPLKAGSSSSGMWGDSPAADEFLGRLARGAIAEMKLGQGPSVDFLGVSFSMTDVVGHAFGPRSHEVQDVLARLDVTIGALLDALDQAVGAGKYVVALSADHGVAVIPEQLAAEGKDAGRISETELRRRLDEAISAELGPGKHAVEVQGNDLYLAPGVPERLREKKGAVARVLAAVKGAPGVAEAFFADELADGQEAKGPGRRAAALSYFPGRSGDLVIVPRPNWILGSIGTNHGTTNDYDQLVPVVFYGAGIKPGKHDRPVSPADIAPTLAKMVGVTMAKAEGQPLVELFSPAAPKAGAQPPAAGPRRASAAKKR